MDRRLGYCELDQRGVDLWIRSGWREKMMYLRGQGVETQRDLVGSLLKTGTQANLSEPKAAT
jgi:hypothetical protein